MHKSILAVSILLVLALLAAPRLAEGATPLSPFDAPSGIAPAPAIPPLSVTLSCAMTCVGVKTRHNCMAAASWGTPPYDFIWSGATPLSTPAANPNSAYHWFFPGDPACSGTVTVIVMDEWDHQASASQTIYADCNPSCG